MMPRADQWSILNQNNTFMSDVDAKTQQIIENNRLLDKLASLSKKGGTGGLEQFGGAVFTSTIKRARHRFDPNKKRESRSTSKYRERKTKESKKADKENMVRRSRTPKKSTKSTGKSTSKTR